MLNNFVDILAAPNQAFTRLKDKPSWFVPWLVIALLLVTVQIGSFSLIDSEYLLDQLVEQSLQPGVSESDLRASMQGVVDNKTALMVSSSLAVSIGMLLVFAITAGYLYLISKFSDHDITYRTWYSLIAWCSVPTIFTAMTAWIVILSSGGLIDLTALAPLNLNNLLFRSEGDFSGLLTAFDLMAIWGVILIVLGYKNFTSTSTLNASIVVLTPYVLILAIWALIIVL